ncbi:glycosyltransferase family 4 protein [Salinicoccus luteus]|uniref:glycosyltransferase family 4 protein n=1 Tax=Salinicoccus luteus TaxID=367840 RepID=UPI0004E0D47E|nr:glycosyltransferase family 4 protein [Salinicoccus luteus]
MEKHILVVSQYFYPEQFRINDIVKEWTERGYKVTVLTGIPNYPQGSFYKGYGLFKRQRESYEGADVIRIPIFPRGKNAIMLSLNYLSFVFSGYIWKIFTKLKVDYVFIFEVSPMTQALPAIAYAKKKKIPSYIYVQDLWPENFEMLSGIKNKQIIKIIGLMVDYIYKNSAKIFTTSKSFMESIRQRGVPNNKVVYWPQYAEDFYQPISNSKNENIDESKFNFIFTGNVGLSQGLDILVDLVRTLEDERNHNKIVFNIVGDGRYKDELIEKIRNYKVEKFFNFIPKQPPEAIPFLLSSSDVAFLSLNPDPLFDKTIPAKLQSYMSCGMPILASSNGETNRIIDEAKAGYHAPAGDIQALKKQVLKFVNIPSEKLEKLSENSLKYAQENFNKKKLMNEIETYFEVGDEE